MLLTEIVKGVAVAAGAAIAAIATGGLFELARAMLDPKRNNEIRHRSLPDNIRHMLS